jgi:hypothetical protein
MRWQISPSYSVLNSERIHKMNFSPQIALGLLALGLVVFPANCASAQYQAIDLSPTYLTDQFPASAYGASGGQQAGRAYGSTFGGDGHAALWFGSSSSFTDLNPIGFSKSQVEAIAGGQEAGYGSGTATGGGTHALLWSGSANSVVDLNPTSLAETYIYSQAEGIGGGQQVGFGQGGSSTHALLWFGTAASAVDLNPASATDSEAFATSGVHQVGDAYGYFSTGQNNHAMEWSGTAASATDINPYGAISSQANAISGNLAVGQADFKIGNNAYRTDAVLWSLAGSDGGFPMVQDLHPAGYEFSRATGIFGTDVVGTGKFNGFDHALLWHGSASNYVDLNKFLPAGYTNAFAQGIDANGDIAGVAFTATDQQGIFGTPHAFLWRPAPVPEASSAALLGLLLALGLGTVLIARKRKLVPAIVR